MLPLFRDLYQGPIYPVAQILDEIRHPERRILHVDLAGLEQEATKIRGVYESSTPTLAGWLTLGMGDSCTRWLDREPDFARARRPMQPCVTLYELTPVLDGGFLLIYKWRIVVRGEDERRRTWLVRKAGDAAQGASMRRLEMAG